MPANEETPRPLSECECGPTCAQEHFCQRCGTELKLSRRVPLVAGFVCARCARRRKKSR
jgi:hypothetical protein